MSKAAAGRFTGSVAMLTEAIHCLVDSAAGRRSWAASAGAARRPDVANPFGYGMALSQPGVPRRAFTAEG